MHTQKKKKSPANPIFTAKAHLLQFKSHPISIVCGCLLKKKLIRKEEKKNPPKIVWPCIKIHVDHLVSPIKTRVSFSLSCNWPKCRSEKKSLWKNRGCNAWGGEHLVGTPFLHTHTVTSLCVRSMECWTAGRKKKKRVGNKKEPLRDSLIKREPFKLPPNSASFV